jgi:site-specific recombinase XerC
VHLRGKGRKQRVIPLWKTTAAELRTWLAQISPAPDAAVFPNRAGTPMTRSGIRDRLDRALTAAAQTCPSLHTQHVTPHTLRHSTVICTALKARGTAQSWAGRIVPLKYLVLGETRATGPGPGSFFFDALFGRT